MGSLELMPLRLFIVSRETPYIAEYMRQQFREEPGVLVFVDRRQGGDRRAASRPVDVERRNSNERRQRAAIEHELRTSFHAMVTIG
jgi:hypothetical protein